MIRRYRPGEEAAIWDIFFCATRESNARDYHPDLIERWAPRDRDMVEWADRLRRTNPFVAVVGDEIVGMAEIDGWCHRLFLRPPELSIARCRQGAASCPGAGGDVAWAEQDHAGREYTAAHHSL